MPELYFPFETEPESFLSGFLFLASFDPKIDTTPKSYTENHRNTGAKIPFYGFYRNIFCSQN